MYLSSVVSPSDLTAMKRALEFATWDGLKPVHVYTGDIVLKRKWTSPST